MDTGKVNLELHCLAAEREFQQFNFPLGRNITLLIPYVKLQNPVSPLPAAGPHLSSLSSGKTSLYSL